MVTRLAAAASAFGARARNPAPPRAALLDRDRPHSFASDRHPLPRLWSATLSRLRPSPILASAGGAPRMSHGATLRTNSEFEFELNAVQLRAFAPNFARSAPSRLENRVRIRTRVFSRVYPTTPDVSVSDSRRHQRSGLLSQRFRSLELLSDRHWNSNSIFWLGWGSQGLPCSAAGSFRERKASSNSNSIFWLGWGEAWPLSPRVLVGHLPRRPPCPPARFVRSCHPRQREAAVPGLYGAPGTGGRAAQLRLSPS